MRDTGHILVTQAYGIIKACSDGASVSLYSSYCSFRSSLDLNVDLCSKNVSTLEERAHMKADLMTWKDENTVYFMSPPAGILIYKRSIFPLLKGFIRFI